MENKTKTLIVTNIITAIIVLALGGYIIFDKVNDKDVAKEDNNKLVENNNGKEEQKENEKNSRDSLFYSTLSEEHKIYLTEDNVVKLVSTSLGTKDIATNVSWIHEISAGMSDICEGNTWLILESGDTDIKYTALSVDTLSCGNEVRTFDLSAELNKKNLKNIVSIYSTKEFINQYEPLRHKVFVIDEDGKSTDITDLFVD
jgi:hypothetical protein